MELPLSGLTNYLILGRNNMKVLMESWKRFITETTDPPKLQLYLSKYPKAKEQKIRDLLAAALNKYASTALNQVKEGYLGNYSSFARFIKSIKGLESETDASLKQNWQQYVKAASSGLDDVPVVTFYDKIEDVPEDYIERKVGAFYDVEAKTIFVNPFIYFVTRFNARGLINDLREEYIHAAQSFIKQALKMPIAHMQTKAAKGLDIFLSQEESGLSLKHYNYLTDPLEFHAKVLRLKFNLARQQPNMFDASGQLTRDGLLKLIDLPTGPEIFKVLDPQKVDKILEFLNRVTMAPKTIEIAKL